MDNISDMLSNVLSDPDAMSKITGMLGSLNMGGNNHQEEEQTNRAQEQKESDNSGIDPDTMFKIMNAISAFSSVDDTRINLLMAIKPYLSAKRTEKFDNAVKIIRFSALSGIMKDII